MSAATVSVTTSPSASFRAGRIRDGSLIRLSRRLSPVLPAVLVLGAVTLAAVAAPLLAPASPTAQDLMYGLEPPGRDYPLGTDHLGRDLLSRVVYGARVSMVVSTAAVLLSAGVGLVVGLVAGYFRGTVDAVASAVIDMQLSFPPVLLAIAIVSALGPNLLNTVLVMAITSWVVYSRLIRGEVLSIREREYVQAAKLLGADSARVLTRHIFPQVVPSLLVLLTLQFGRMVVLEATLSFLGLGVQPPDPSLGSLLADSRDYIQTAWWVTFFPGIAISLTVWATNLVGDWLRDVLDPRLSR